MSPCLNDLFPDDAGHFWLACLRPTCEVSSRYDADDDPERCSCGAAYEGELYYAEMIQAQEAEIATASIDSARERSALNLEAQRQRLRIRGTEDRGI